LLEILGDILFLGKKLEDRNQSAVSVNFQRFQSRPNCPSPESIEEITAKSSIFIHFHPFSAGQLQNSWPF